MDDDFNTNDLKETENKKHASIDFFIHENDMMMKDIDNERLHKTIRSLCVTFIAIIVIFVAAYTIRTNIWLGTISRMNEIIAELASRSIPAAEVHDAVHQQPD